MTKTSGAVNETRLISINFERLVSEPETQARRLSTFLGLDFSSR